VYIRDSFIPFKSLTLLLNWYNVGNPSYSGKKFDLIIQKGDIVGDRDHILLPAASHTGMKSVEEVLFEQPLCLLPVGRKYVQD
jgi:hypothetical protein